jgi:hypothetical protein
MADDWVESPRVVVTWKIIFFLIFFYATWQLTEKKILKINTQERKKNK